MAGIPVIKTHKPIAEVGNLTHFLKESGDWHNKHIEHDTGMLSNLWYRGVNQHFDSQAPGVYRDDFTQRAAKFKIKGDLEDKCLRLEREMISNFRSAGSEFVHTDSPADILFTAQHFGMPTRLLDWSTNPLAALFFACSGKFGDDGFVYAMDARKVIPDDARKANGEKLWPQVMLRHNPLADYAMKLSLWYPEDNRHKPYVLPIRPDVMPGRIGAQSSCFTLHMHRAAPVDNATLITIKVIAAKKGAILDELHRVNINQFTAYHDLDHLSKEIRRGWGL
jgi:hypothetical protein